MDEGTKATPATTIVEAVNLKKTYMLGKVPVNALDGVSLKVDGGDFLAVLGPSGSGESTLNLIGAVDKPIEGKLLIEDLNVSTLNDDQLADLRRRIGFVVLFFNLIPRFTPRALALVFGLDLNAIFALYQLGVLQSLKQ
jgi:putative ABC transport system ATP-binding protein